MNEYKKQAEALVGKMTLEEKAELVSGFGMWETKGCERLGLTKVDMSDGPNGIRKQLDYYDIAEDKSVQAVCFPTGSCTACSWDIELMKELGVVLGKIAKKHSLSLLLGPAINMKRSPLCGRNFEYLSEDPYAAGEMGAAYIKGLQSTGVSAAVKHFAANNQETRRFSVDAVVEERALREIYLPAFEKAVKEAKADVVMSAYNSLNGEPCTANKNLLGTILRDEWGFEGMVVSDWGAVTDDTAAVKAGNDLKMPGFPKDAAGIAAAVKEGSLSEQDLNSAAANVAAFMLRHSNQNEASGGAEDDETYHAFARKVARESMVLLKNDGLLPLSKGKKILIAGEFAVCPHYQGGGSSHVNACRVDSAVDCFAESGWDFRYVKNLDDKAALAAEANHADIILVFAGTPESDESEGFDRVSIDLPENQNEAIKLLADTGRPVAVILFEGSAVAMPWKDRVSAILAAFLPGEAGAAAAVDIITGAQNPCGKLAETFPQKLSDTPAHLYFPGDRDVSIYGEGIFIGYRYYEKKAIEPLFPFGHGLSYTDFAYGGLRINGRDAAEPLQIRDDETITVQLTVKNTGGLAGKETVQLYVACKNPEKKRPVKELKGFVKLELAPGEEKEITFNLDYRSFAYYDTEIHDWYAPGGIYAILAGASSADIRSKALVSLQAAKPFKRKFTRNTLMEDILKTEQGRNMLMPLVDEVNAGTGEDKKSDGAYMKMIFAMPVKALSIVGVPLEKIDALTTALNAVESEEQ
ncbi:MAG: glycoside hydrolase family 3 C-terminal domain-containing protein [Treponema sp.]|jgi:beta-glucosidase|nr:glycoside hydrolase family 3 C-terminal domain-containing protein [Treponema sp.]